ncbi:MAG: hypothetical protein WC205_11235 [Opitutaceae bacterium]|jgi:hypothetical protein
MLSSLKKSSDKSSALAVPAWHPNFRNFQRLPDTKVVRTTFFINGVAVLIASLLTIYTGYREFGLNSLSSDVSAAMKIASENKQPSDQAVAQFKLFQDQEKKVLELQSFLSASKIVTSEFILELGASLPPGFTIATFDCRANGAGLRGGIKGAPEEASGRAVAYVEELRRNAYFSKLFDPITLTNIARDGATGQIRFEIDLKYRASASKPAGGKK